VARIADGFEHGRRRWRVAATGEKVDGDGGRDQYLPVPLADNFELRLAAVRSEFLLPAHSTLLRTSY
jgi:hypothetical protein